jgi:hypothetical protein
VVPVAPVRQHPTDAESSGCTNTDPEPAPAGADPTTRPLHPGEGGEPPPAHETTKIIGEFLKELD